MATNEILRFAETDTGTNLLTQAEYLADSQRPIGNQPGVARSKLVNKALRQSSLIAAAVAQFIADNQANNVVDTAAPADIANWIEAATLSLATQPDASETVKGIVELATSAEVQTGTDAVRAVTPAALASVTATDTRAGLIELATAAEILAGDATRAATGATLLAGLLGAGGISSNDYIRIPFRDKTSGVIRYFIAQWGVTASISNGGSSSITFPLTFPSLVFAIYRSENATSSYTGGSESWLSSKTLSGVTINHRGLDTYTGSMSYFWLAIGY